MSVLQFRGNRPKHYRDSDLLMLEVNRLVSAPEHMTLHKVSVLKEASCAYTSSFSAGRRKFGMLRSDGGPVSKGLTFRYSLVYLNIS